MSPSSAWSLATVVGGAFSAGSASVFNCVYDRDIDEQMRRTRRRALPRHLVSPRAALIFGFTLAVLSTVVLLLWVNTLSAVLALLANAFYVFGYTMLLKRRTTQNIVWGGLAGCFPALIGWTAVTGELAWTPVVLFAVVFFWTPPHTWALALRYREDYANVDVPDAPGGGRRPARSGARSCVYSWVMVAVSLLLWPVAGTGAVYPVAAVVLGAGFLLEAHRMWAPDPGDRGPERHRADAAVPLLQPLPVAAVRRRRAGPAADSLVSGPPHDVQSHVTDNTCPDMIILSGGYE